MAGQTQTLGTAPTEWRRLIDMKEIKEVEDIPDVGYLPIETTNETFITDMRLLFDLFIPHGVAFPFFGKTVPRGFIVYDGRQFDTTANPKLYALFPNGKVPDMKGRVPEGYESASGGSIGALMAGGVGRHGHTGTISNGGSHDHPISATAHSNGLHSHRTPRVPHNGNPKSESVDITSSSMSGGYDDRETTRSGAHSHNVTGKASKNGDHGHGLTINDGGSGRNTVDRIICQWIGRLG